MVTYAIDSNEQGVAVVFHDLAKKTRPRNYLLAIPYSLILTDMFYKEALTPQTEMLTATKGDIPAVLAYQVLDAYINDSQIPSNVLNDKMKPSIDLMLKAVAYEYIRTDYTDTEVDALITEMAAMIPPNQTLMVKPMIRNINKRVNAFMRSCLIQLPMPQRIKLCLELRKAYDKLGQRTPEYIKGVKFHQEKLQ